MRRWIDQNATLMSFKQLCQIWTCKINSTKCPFWMSNNFRKYPKTKARKIQDFEFLFSNSRTFKDVQVLYERCLYCFPLPFSLYIFDHFSFPCLFFNSYFSRFLTFFSTSSLGFLPFLRFWLAMYFYFRYKYFDTSI